MMPYQSPCPEYPETDPWYRLLANIQKAITGEAGAIQRYTKLLGMATTEEDKMNLQKIIGDERKHFAAFQQLYRCLTGVPPVLGQVPSPTFKTYAEGLKESLYDELEDAEFYRGILLSTCDPRVMRVFYEAQTDEMMHATRFSRLLYLAEEAED